jgi:hypothetical protein
MNRRNEEIFETKAHNEDLTKKGVDDECLSVPSEFGGGFYYQIDEGEEIKKDEREQSELGGEYCYHLDESEEIKHEESQKSDFGEGFCYHLDEGEEIKQ